MNTWVFFAVVVATLCAVNVVAFLRRGHDRGRFHVYFADPNRHGSIAILASLVGTIVGGGMFLAVGQMGFEAGVVGFVMGAAYLVGFVLLGMFAVTFRRVLDEAKAKTLVDLIERKYSKRVAVQFSVVSAAMYFFLLGGQFVALYIFAKYAESLCAFAWVPWLLVGLGIVSLLAYPVIGGLRKDISTDLFQVLLVLGAAAAITAYMVADTTFRGMWNTLPRSHLSGTGGPGSEYGLLFLVGVLLFVPGLFLVRNDLWQRIRAAREPARLRQLFVWAGVASCLFYVLFTLVGMWAFAKGGATAKTATLDMVVRSAQGPVGLGLIIGAFFAAVMSSADTFINNASAFFARVCCPALWAKVIESDDQDADRKLVWWSRVFALGVTLVGALIAWISSDIVDLMVGAFSLLLMYLPVVLGTFVRTWRSERGAFYGPFVGVTLFLVLFFAWSPKLAFAPAVVVSIAIFAWFRSHDSASSDERTVAVSSPSAEQGPREGHSG